MLIISVGEKGGPFRDRNFEQEEVTVGRIQGNDIVLPRGNVSKKHARIVARDGKLVVLDLRSTNGTYVNGKRIAAPQVLRSSDKVQIGDFIIQVVEDREATGVSLDKAVSRSGKRRASSEADKREEAPMPPPSRGVSLDEESGVEISSTAVEAEPEAASGSRSPAVSSVAKRQKRDIRNEDYTLLQQEIHTRLIKYLDLKRLDIERLGDEELWSKTEHAVRDIIGQMEADKEVPAWVDVELLVKDVLNEALGLGPLEEYLADPTITEVMVNHAKQIYIERAGKLFKTDKTFSSDIAVMGVIERIVAPLGRRIDESSPMVDARLKDGSRVNAVIPPLALKGPSITIRKFKKDTLTTQQLLKYGSLTPAMSEFLEMCVQSRKNIIVSGGTGSGKTTTLNCLSAFIPETERIVTVEDAAELQLNQEHWVSLESRPPNIEGKGQISIRDLVRNTLRMRPDRIIVGECRGGEALDMLQAMNTGHDGSLTTLHANSPRDCLSRLETMVLMSGMDLPIRAIREQIASAVNIIVQQARFSDGSRRITFVTEVTGMEQDVISLQNIFYFKQEGFDKGGRVLGKYTASGFIPKFFDDLQRRGMSVNMDIFREQ